MRFSGAIIHSLLKAVSLPGILIFGAAASGQPARTPDFMPQHWSERPLVIAHRGASGERPEHTLAAYDLGIERGADFIEPDLVITADGYLVARHEPFLSQTTDVAERTEFADKRRVLNGRSDWWTFDFTLAQLKTLRARQPRPERGRTYDGAFDIPTFGEVIALAANVKADTGRTVGLYPEIKHAPEMIAMGLDPTEALLDGLAAASAAGLPVYLQAFDAEYLVALRDRVSVPLVLLVGRGPDGPSVNVEAYADRIDGIGADKTLVLDSRGNWTAYGRALQAFGLPVHIWTLRDDDVRRGYGSVEAELGDAFEAGVDGVFSDFPGTAVTVRDRKRLISPPALDDIAR